MAWDTIIGVNLDPAYNHYDNEILWVVCVLDKHNL